jgi:hypothetical protein
MGGNEFRTAVAARHWRGVVPNASVNRWVKCVGSANPQRRAISAMVVDAARVTQELAAGDEPLADDRVRERAPCPLPGLVELS